MCRQWKWQIKLSRDWMPWSVGYPFRFPANSGGSSIVLFLYYACKQPVGNEHEYEAEPSIWYSPVHTDAKCFRISTPSVYASYAQCTTMMTMEKSNLESVTHLQHRRQFAQCVLMWPPPRVDIQLCERNWDYFLCSGEMPEFHYPRQGMSYIRHINLVLVGNRISWQIMCRYCPIDASWMLWEVPTIWLYDVLQDAFKFAHTCNHCGDFRHY